MRLSCLLLTGCLLSLMTGCATVSVNSVENADKVAAMHIIRDARVNTDHRLADDLGVVQLNTAVNKAGFQRLQVEMENFSRRILTINMLVEWYDADAMRINTAGNGWQQVVFNARESRSLVFTAPTRDARDFRIKLQNAEE